MKNIFFTLITLCIVLFSCDVEKIKESELSGNFGPVVPAPLTEADVLEPCGLTINTAFYGTSPDNVTSTNFDNSASPVGSVNAPYEYHAFTNLNGYVNFFFLNDPVTGKYISKSGNTPQSNFGSNNVVVELTYLSTVYDMMGNDTIYVYRNPVTNDVNISFCNASFSDYNFPSNVRNNLSLKMQY